MKKRRTNILSAALALVMLTLSFTALTAEADGYVYIPYKGYSYDIWGEAVPSAVAYRPQQYILGTQGENTLFVSPVDMFIDEKGQIYVLNKGSEGIVILDQSYQQVGEIKEFTDQNGGTVQLVAPNGLFVKDGLVYIADTDQEMVIISDLSGKIKDTITKPTDETFPQDTPFRPQKVLVDNTNTTYVLVEGIYQGAAAFDKDFNFIEFYGSNRVAVTADLLAQEFWRMFMTEKQIDGSFRNVPVEYTSFDVDEDGFIYTCTATNETSTDEIRKLNAVGVNILPSANYGDQKTNYYKNHTIDSHFVDVCVNEDGFIYGMDQERGRIFVYDGEGQEVFIFGGKGAQLGVFQKAVAIESFGRNIYVLDSEKSAITVFSPTEYGAAVYNATVAFMDGRHEESKVLWEQVITQNANCKIGYIGIGKALYQEGDLEGAMHYFTLGGAKTQESNVYTDWRKNILRKYADIIITAIAIVVVAIFAIRWFQKRRSKKTAGEKK